MPSQRWEDTFKYPQCDNCGSYHEPPRGDECKLVNVLGVKSIRPIKPVKRDLKKDFDNMMYIKRGQQPITLQALLKRFPRKE